MTLRDIASRIWNGPASDLATPQPMAAGPSEAAFLMDGGSKVAASASRADKPLIVQKSRIARTSDLVGDITPLQVAEAVQAGASGNIGRLQGLYKRTVATDARFSGLVRVLHSGLLANPLRVFPSKTKTPESKEYALIAQEMLRMMQHTKLVKRLAEVYLSGIRVFEPKWVTTNGVDGQTRIIPYDLSVVPPTLYRVDTEADSKTFGELKIVTDEERDGKLVSSYPWGRLIVATDGTEEGFYDLAGAIRPCLFWYLVKTKNAQWWAEFNELYGEPQRTAFFDRDVTDERELAKTEEFLKLIGRASYALVPNDIDLETLTVDKAGTIKTYDDLIDLANIEMAIAILGQTQTSDGGDSGSYAKAYVHMGVQYLILKSLALLLKEIFDDLILATVAFNVGPGFNPADLPEIRLVVPNPEEKEVKARVFKYAQEIGLSIPKQHAQDELGIPEPDEDDEILEPVHLQLKQQQGTQTDAEMREGRDYNQEDETRQRQRKDAK